LQDDANSDWERRWLLRAFRQELESLARAGLDRVPAAPHVEGPATLVTPREPASHERPAVSASFRAADGSEPPPHADSNQWLQQADPHQSSAALRPARELPAAAPPSALLGPIFKEPEFVTPPVPVCDRPALLETLASVVAGCRKCAYLAETRTQTVFGTGPAETRLMFIGEAPGADEDRQGKPFVGRAGQLLTDMITKGMGLSRDQVFIANVLKCRPPENRTPTLQESDNCIGYLEEQIAIIRPEFICLLGRVALQGLLKSDSSMGRARGKWYYYKGIPTIVTYHPSYLLRRPEAKREVWEDLQMLMKEMGLKPPERKGRAE
jgi:uracil-DNA glycosylase family 4